MGGCVTFQVGQTVGIPCNIQGGAFSSEYLVSIVTDDGILSGFADQSNVRPDPRNPERGTIRATVVSVAPDEIKVRIYGSFFTTAAGMMQFSSSWAQTNLRA